MRNKQEAYITDTTITQIYTFLWSIKHKRDLYKNSTKHSDYYDTFNKTIFIDDKKVDKNLTIFLGQNNINWVDFNKCKIINETVDEIIDEMDIASFIDYFRMAVLGDEFYNFILRSIPTKTFKTSEFTQILKKAYVAGIKSNILFYDENRGNRVTSTILTFLSNMNIITKIKQGSYSPKPREINIRHIIINGRTHLYKRLVDLNNILQNRNTNNNIAIFEQELKNIIYNAINIKTLYSNSRRGISQENEAEALYQYLIIGRDTKEIDNELAKPNNSMYINTTVNKYNLSRKYHGYFSCLINDNKYEIKSVIQNIISTYDYWHVDVFEKLSNTNDEIFITDRKSLVINKKKTSPTPGSETSTRTVNTEKKMSSSRKENGQWAEEYTYNKLISMMNSNISNVLRSEAGLIKAVQPIYSINTNAGYDIKIITDKQEYKIEVKSIMSQNKGSFFISENEINTLAENGWIAFVSQDRKINVLSFEEVKESAEKKPINYQWIIRK